MSEIFKLLNNKQVFHLILISILVKMFMLFFGSILVKGLFIDMFDLQNYILNGVNILNGGTPYISFDYEYALFSLVPMVISAYASTYAIIVFQLLMILCDIITMLCIYLIVSKLYNKHKAYIASIIYICSLSAIYTVVTRYDALPVCLMMISILLFIYKDNANSYIVSTIGFFTKVFPIVTLPFFIIHNYKTDGLTKLKECYLVPILIALVCIVPLYIIGGFKVLKPYLFATGSTTSSVYANTFTFTLYSWLQIFKINIDLSIISFATTAIMIVSIGYILYYIYKLEDFNFKEMIKYICITLCILIICTKFHSPQYFMWFTPLMAILVVDKLEKIAVFFIFQLLTIIEFPLMFGSFYNNVSYIGANGSIPWWISILFFTIEYSILFILMYMIVKD